MKDNHVSKSALITREWLEMQIAGLDKAIIQVQTQLLELNGSKKSYQWMLGMLDKNRLGLMEEPKDAPEEKEVAP